MKVLVCVKRVPAPGAKINITADGQAVDTAYLAFTTSPHEECAVEEAVQLVEQHGGESTVLTLGPAEADEQLRYAASIGVNKAVLLPIDSAEWDPQRTAAAITSAIQGIESADGPFDLILFGNESADAGNFQVGVRVAYALARPIVNSIRASRSTATRSRRGVTAAPVSGHNADAGSAGCEKSTCPATRHESPRFEEDRGRSGRAAGVCSAASRSSAWFNRPSRPVHRHARQRPRGRTRCR
jgi:hypothetical protein